MKNNSLAEIAAYLKGQQQLTLICHVRPDGDTLGCAFGLKDLLEQLGKEVTVLCADPVSPRYRFLSGGAEHLNGEPKGGIVCLDVAAAYMAGAYEELALRADAVIDHHPTNPRYGKLNYVDAAAGAAGEIMVELAKLLTPLTPFAAEAFYTAISTDTGCFKYGNTTARTHRAAAELIEAGFDLQACNKWLFQTKRKAEFELNRMAMETIRFFDEGRLASMLISLEMQQKSGAGPDELEEISSLPIQLEGVKAAATFKELKPSVYKVSVRTTGTVHGGEVCGLFGGGGHRQAAGCTLECPYAEAEEKMMKALQQALEQAE
ncbi:MAG: bifunctional oligoribonuclease/PAP phosphatase NrnA [Clostridia bacterium]|nr:bifunctional oligoribonuclease/PAP phosphatase NrnA [Clostridia bacterium]